MFCPDWHVHLFAGTEKFIVEPVYPVPQLLLVAVTDF
jgi:hypothetical protein